MGTDFVEESLGRFLAAWENQIRYNMSPSGVKPLTVRELLDLEDGDSSAALNAIADGTHLDYPQTNGEPLLRERIAALYPGATADNVLVTSGAIAANFTSLVTVTDPGDHVAVMEPNYPQFWGLVQSVQRRLSTFSLKKELGWGLDRDELAAAVRPTTKLVTVVNPNNPTGHLMTADERAAVIEAAAQADAFLLADEINIGCELFTDELTPTFYGEYDKVLVVSSVSKTYGLPGLRIGWVVGPADVVARAWAWQDYTTIATGMLDNVLAAVALSPQVRPKLIARTREYVRRGFECVERWAEDRDDIEVIRPDASAFCLVRYRQEITAENLIMRLAKEKDTLVAPGNAFSPPGVLEEGYLRIGIGQPVDYLNEGLRRLGELLDAVGKAPGDCRQCSTGV